MPDLSLSSLKQLKRSDWLELIARWAVAAVFIFAGWPKLVGPAEFAESISNYQLIDDSWVAPLAVFLPPLELLAAGALITGVGKRGAALISAGMLTVFAIAIAQTVIRGIDIDCGCFGATHEARASWWSVARNCALIACCTLIILHPANSGTRSEIN